MRRAMPGLAGKTARAPRYVQVVGWPRPALVGHALVINRQCSARAPRDRRSREGPGHGPDARRAIGARWAERDKRGNGGGGAVAASAAPAGYRLRPFGLVLVGC